MKPSVFLAAAVAVVAIAGCNSKSGDAKNNATAAGPVKWEMTAPPKGGDWTNVINGTPDGGVMMGDPNAKVHLIEIGSLTCPHCREFDEKGVTPLIAKYVKTGKISYEFRNYIRDAFDLSAVLIAHCNGPKGYFPLARALYKDQLGWVGKIQAVPQDQLEGIQNLPENQLALQAAKYAGLQEWAAARGVPVAKSTQCLTDAKTIDKYVNSASSIPQDFPDFTGTPNFIVDGKLDNKIGSWEQLDAALTKALGG